MTVAAPTTVDETVADVPVDHDKPEVSGTRRCGSPRRATGGNRARSAGTISVGAMFAGAMFVGAMFVRAMFAGVESVRSGRRA